MRVLLVGAGRWGSVLAKKLKQMGMLVAVADVEPTRRKVIGDASTGLDVLIVDDWTHSLAYCDAVVVATPPSSHFEIAKTALEQGKHVLVEKPLATNVEDAEVLNSIAHNNGKVLMVGHTAVHASEIQAAKNFILGGDIGEIKYIHAARLNLGTINPDGVIMTLAPHDIAIFDYFLPSDRAVEVSATGQNFISNNGTEEVAFLNIRYNSGVLAHLHLSWIDPRKYRAVTIVGSKKMLVATSTPVAKIEIFDMFDKGVVSKEAGGYSDFILGCRHGSVISPYLEVYEPLEAQFKKFKWACDHSSESIRADGNQGVRVVAIMEAARESIKKGGGWIPIEIPIDGSVGTGFSNLI